MKLDVRVKEFIERTKKDPLIERWLDAVPFTIIEPAEKRTPRRMGFADIIFVFCICYSPTKKLPVIFPPDNHRVIWGIFNV